MVSGCGAIHIMTLECSLAAALFHIMTLDALWPRCRAHYDPRMLSGCSGVHIPSQNKHNPMSNSYCV